MKKFTKFLLLSLLILAVAYTGVWWTKSNAVQEHLTVALNQIANSKHGDYRFEYAGIDRQGFPSSIEFAIKNPRLLSLKDNSQISLDGNLVVGRSILDAHQATLKLTGDNRLSITAKTEDSDKLDTQNWLLSGDLSFACDCTEQLQLLQQQTEFTYEEMQQFLTSILQDFSLQAKNFLVTDDEIKEKFFMIEQGVFNVTAVQNSQSSYDFKIDSNLKGIIIFAKNGDSQSDLSFKSHGVFPPFTHPFFTTYAFKDFPVGSVTIDEWESNQTNKLFKSHSKGNLAFAKNEAQQITAQFKDNSQTAINHFSKEKIYQFYRSALEDSQNKGTIELVQWMDQHQEDLINLVPDSNIFSKLETIIDWDLQAIQDPERHLRDVNFHIKNFDLQTNQYQMNLSGEFEEPRQLIDFTLKLSNYQELFHHLIDYYNRWLTFLKKINHEQANAVPLIPFQVVDRLNVFLREISNDPQAQSQDLAITFKRNENEASVGTLNINDLFKTYMQFIRDVSPYFQGEAPAQQVETQQIDENLEQNKEL